MVPLTPEYREYKERSLNQLLANLPLLEAKLAQEERPGVIISLENQVGDIQAHISRLQKELAEDIAGEPVADELCKRIARALSKDKFHLAKKYINKLETIEPFYPGIDRLRNEAEAGRASRRTRSIVQGAALPYGAAAFSSGLVTERIGGRRSVPLANTYIETGEAEKRGFSQLFQFHIIISCLLVSLIICVMTSMGGFAVLQWLIEGN
jgi:F0F1-type ATP synthase membrane subunit c/vacuolar-type H+-ATPase subunit K